MRKTILVAVALLGLAACSDGDPQAGDRPAGKPGADATATVSPGGGAPGMPGTPAPGATGTASDKAACTAITAKLSDWGLAFATAVGGLGESGSDTSKINAAVQQVKAANTKFAGELRTEAGKTQDAQVKKVATDLAGALEKINGQLDPRKIAADPTALTAGFDSPEYAAAADAYERVCAGA